MAQLGAQHVAANPCFVVGNQGAAGDQVLYTDVNTGAPGALGEENTYSTVASVPARRDSATPC